ncbi:hypothetical protein FisN_9Lh027 [Fistulifera solaris]|uniref:RNA polymerase sigma-70 region 2 domain-containing protein n=1 Tax=Fistulifera solaris TaxID=1519565 RepID=A0A1Z5JHI2_FISSO|nr:hypothetical protein FisN_9Lh027 [Fistulifera solaris]|eukprot:GAX13386.1 hypothetical protein FisN_9Lh027 [Fistulifera solaris]
MTGMTYRFLVATIVSAALLLSVATAFQPLQPQQTPKRLASVSVQSLVAPTDEKKATIAASWPATGIPNHKILTKAQEQKLGKAIQRARKLRQWLEQHPTQAKIPLDDASIVYALSSSVTSHESSSYHNYTQAQIDTILEKGHQAKQKLMMYNLRLVSKIAKKWAYMTHYKNGDYISNANDGSLTRPSIQEAIQEGIEGLARAVDRYDPTKNWRFSTYATYWITDSIRNCYASASNGHAMRLPSAYHETVARYKSLIKEQYHLYQAAPPMENLAAQMDLKLSRLQKILRLAQPPLSLDGPTSSFASAGKSGIADASTTMLGDILVMGTSEDPEALLEWSMLRGALEHALVTQLSPHERDVVRLRSGLDDGVTRTFRQVSVDCYEGKLSPVQIQVTWVRALKKLRSPEALSKYGWMSYFELCDVDPESVSL